MSVFTPGFCCFLSLVSKYPRSICSPTASPSLLLLVKFLPINTDGHIIIGSFVLSNNLFWSGLQLYTLLQMKTITVPVLSREEGTGASHLLCPLISLWQHLGNSQQVPGPGFQSSCCCKSAQVGGTPDGRASSEETTGRYLCE